MGSGRGQLREGPLVAREEVLVRTHVPEDVGEQPRDLIDDGKPPAAGLGAEDPRAIRRGGCLATPAAGVECRERPAALGAPDDLQKRSIHRHASSRVGPCLARPLAKSPPTVTTYRGRWADRVSKPDAHWSGVTATDAQVLVILQELLDPAVPGIACGRARLPSPVADLLLPRPRGGSQPPEFGVGCVAARKVQPGMRVHSARQAVNTALNDVEFRLQRPVVRSMPQNVDIVLTKACNLACTFCVDYETPGAKRISLENFEKVARQLFPTARLVSMCSGGEPYLHKGLEDLLRIARRYQLETWVLCNG